MTLKITVSNDEIEVTVCLDEATGDWAAAIETPEGGGQTYHRTMDSALRWAVNQASDIGASNHYEFAPNRC